MKRENFFFKEKRGQFELEQKTTFVEEKNTEQIGDYQPTGSYLNTVKILFDF